MTGWLDDRAPLSRVFTAVLAVALLTVAVLNGHLDALPFARRTEGTLTLVEPLQETRPQRKGGQLTRHRVGLRYEFHVDGQTWIGINPYAFHDGWGRGGAAPDPALQGLRPGQRVTVWYDSRRPEDAWLLWDGVWLTIDALLVLAAAACLAWSVRRRT